jgi:rubrerythrin
MSYTTSKMPQGFPYCWTNMIREAMIGELVAINDYREHIAKSNVKDINEVWYHIMEDEKRHYGIFLELLRKYDPQEAEKYKEALEHVNLTKKEEIPPCKISSQECILNLIRNDIKGELEAVILYEQHMLQIPNKEVKEVYYEIIGDEKEHTEELTLLLMKYDKNQYGPIEKRSNSVFLKY